MAERPDGGFARTPRLSDLFNPPGEEKVDTVANEATRASVVRPTVDAPVFHPRKPKPVEAMEFTVSTASRIQHWTGGLVVQEQDPHDRSVTFVGLNLPTLSGMKRVNEGDYVIRHMNGSFDKLTASEFEAEYGEGEEPSSTS